MHTPDGEKRGGAEAARSLAPLVMLVVSLPIFRDTIFVQ